MKHLFINSLMAVALVVSLPVLTLAAVSTTRPAQMYFDPSSGTVAANPNFSVNVKVNIGTGAQSAGADAVILFDTTKLELVSNPTKVTAGNPSTFYGENGLFTATPAATANTTGKIEIGRTAEPGIYASGTGTLANLVFKPKVAVGQTVALTLDYTEGSTTDSNVAGNTGGVDLLGAVTNASLTIGAGNTAGPAITGISPSHGDKSLAQSITIAGVGFGATQGTNGKVYLGTDLVTVTSWSDSSIMVNLPAKSDLTTTTTYPVKVVRDDLQEVSFTGYTYDVAGTLPKNGPEAYSYLGLAMSAFGMAGLSYQKLFGRKVQTSLGETETPAETPTLAD